MKKPNVAQCASMLLEFSPVMPLSVHILSGLLQEAKDNHPPADKDWPSWYARFMYARIKGSSTEEATESANAPILEQLRAAKDYETDGQDSGDSEGWDGPISLDMNDPRNYPTPDATVEFKPRNESENEWVPGIGWINPGWNVMTVKDENETPEHLKPTPWAEL